MRRIVIAAVLCLGVAACSSNSSPPVTSSNPAPQSSTQQVTTSVAPTATSAVATPTEAGNGCQWDSGAQKGGTQNTDAAIYSVRVGQHDCYERVVFDLNGVAANVTYDVEYGPVGTEGHGTSLTIPGAKSLRVVIHAPAQGDDNSGHQPGKQLAQVGDYVVPPTTVQGWQSLRGVRFGGTFEQQSTFLIGVVTQRGLHVAVTVDSSQITHVAVDVATG